MTLRARSAWLEKSVILSNLEAIRYQTRIPIEYLEMRKTILAEERPSHASMEPALWNKLINDL